MVNFKKKKQSGFTLIELVVVIVILGILATIAGTRYAAMTQSSEDSVAKANLRAIKSAITMYSAQHQGEFLVASDVEVSTLTDLVKLLEKDAYTKPAGYTYKYTGTASSDTAPATYDVTVTGGGLPNPPSIANGTKYTENGEE